MVYIEDKEEISMAAALLQEISQDEHERARLRSRKMYEMDMYSNYHTALEKGVIRGRAEGITQGKSEGIIEGQAKVIALLEKGVPLEEIKKNLGI